MALDGGCCPSVVFASFCSIFSDSLERGKRQMLTPARVRFCLFRGRGGGGEFV